MGTLLPDDGADRYVRTLRTTLGDDLRSVTFFTRDDYEQLYLRDDLAKDADLMSFIGHEWFDFKTTENAYRNSELGAHWYTLRAFENGYLVRVETDRKGAFFTTDGPSLAMFEEAATGVAELLDDG